MKIMDSILFSLILMLYIPDSLTLENLSVMCSEKSICAEKGSQVTLKCSYDNRNVKTVFWFSHKQSTNWRKNNYSEDLTLDSDYSGRVKSLINNYQAQLKITDVRERDSGEYQLMFIMEDGVKHLASVAISLTVTELQLRMNPQSTDSKDQTVELTCDSSCTPEFCNYFWMRSGQYFKHTDSKNMFVSVSRDSGSYSCSLDLLFKNPFSVCVSQSGCWDVTYTSRRVCALINSTVEISSIYSHPSDYTVIKTFWHYVQPGEYKDLLEEHQFAGRVEYVENKLRIKELKISDSGKYQFRIITDKDGKYSGSPGVILTVTDTHVISSLDVISEGEKVILSCSTKCTLSDKHTYIWYKNGRQVTDGFTKANKLYLDSVSSEELQGFSCAVGEAVDSTVYSHYTVILLVFLPQFLTIAALWIWFFIRMKLISKPD